jgi:O-antigen ligase
LSAATMIYNIGANRYGAAYYNLTFSADTLGQAPFAFAAFAVLVTPLVLAGMLGPGARKGGLWIVGALAIGIVLSYVRTTLIAFAIVVFVGAVIALRRRQHHALRRSAFAMVAVGCVLGYFALDRLAQRFSNLLLITQSGSARLAAGSGRLGIWTAVWDGATHSVQSVLVGSGSGASFGYVSEGYGGRFWAHNDFLEFFASGGLIGIGLYFALLVWIIRSVIALRRTAGTNQDVRDFAALAAATVCAYVAISIMSGVVFSLQSSLVMAVLVGLVRAMTRTPGATFLEAAACAEPSESAGRRIRGGADGLRQALT